jgi:hypothetical protein
VQREGSIEKSHDLIGNQTSDLLAEHTVINFDLNQLVAALKA